jgi:RHS repeat-associated protein
VRDRRLGREYRRDAAGRIAAIHDLRQGDSRYTYDPAGQLLDVLGVTPERFVHDPAGNLLGGGDAQVEGDRLLMQGDRHFRYDAAGDLVEERRGTGGRLVTRYEYDASHRLVAAHTPQGTSRYRYDALGRRVAKTTSAGETRFFWDGATLLGESEAAEAHGVGEVAASTRWYVYEPGSFRPLACVQRGRRVSALRLAARDGQALAAPPAGATELFHYHLDHLGTPREMTDARGRIVWSARYRAWGALAVADVDEVDNPLRFQGQYHDAETGLYYNFQRYYDPRTGRFVTQDPIQLGGGENLYRYAANPVHWVDPLGLACNELSSKAQEVHDLAGGGDERSIRNSTVAIVEARSNGETQLYAAGSGGRLSPAQRAALVERGVPEENIFHGKGVVDGYDKIDNHAERIILRNLPEGSEVTRWGISWGGLQRNEPCVNCAPYVEAAGGIFD